MAAHYGSGFYHAPAMLDWWFKSSRFHHFFFNQDIYATLCLLASASGLRCSELFALKVGDVSTQRSLSDKRREHPWSFWTIVVVLVILNGWWDYYHPLGILFDVIIVIIWAVRSDIRSRHE